ncbi:larval cuticle protein LCP-17-like [Trichogramma pretiosum]|uniref:larval cuticle protein LCP-17-like n=1 Tax=Trichogramma pretiosum TaxID=7493 RepID=UPI000C7195DD|nr:larval cuticle protein LCP-17-like [Trichogramma pretiosum]
MKFILAVLALAAVAYAQEQRPIAILRQAHPEIHPEGHYSHSFETENGIYQQEQGSASVPGETGKVVASQGSYQYTAPDGQVIQVQYTADQNGFQAQGDHLPKAHPIPEAIARSLEYIRTHPQPVQQQAAQPAFQAAQPAFQAPVYKQQPTGFGFAPQRRF